MDDSKKEKDIISIPISFKSSKDLYIGKGSLKNNIKSSFKFANPKTQTTNTSSKYYIKEFILINKDKSKKDIFYKGREAPQDSNYILMKYNSDIRSIQICPANKWMNFIQSFNYKEEKIEKKEDQKKKEMKEKYKNFKDIFNFEYFEEMKKDNKQKKNTRKKKTLLPSSNDEDIEDDDNNKDDDDDDDSLTKKKKKKNKYDYDEDSHSSENSLGLKEDSYESELERKKEEKLIKEEEEKRKKEEEKKREREREEDNQSDDDDSDDNFEDVASDVDENEDNNELFNNFLLNKKRDREKCPYENMKEELANLFRKKNKRTYDEIAIELIKKFNKELVEQYIEKLLDENTSKFIEGKESYYFLK